MSADFIVTIIVRPSSKILFSKVVRLWSPQLYFLNYASLNVSSCIMIRPANLLLENKRDTTSDS